MATKKPAGPGTIDDYLAPLAEDRREMVETLLATIRANADPKYAEGIQYRMPAFFLPHEHYPAGYHCDPREPLPFASVAATKGGASIYLFCTYCDPAEQERVAKEWKATGNRLDMGKGCIRVKKLEQVPLDVLGRAVKRMTAAKFVKAYETNVPGAGKKAAKKPVKKTAEKPAKKPATKAAKKPAKRSSKGSKR